MIIWTFRIQKLKIGSLADFEKKSFSSLFLMRKPLSSDQKWFLRPYFPLIGGIFVLKSGLRFLFRALEVSIQKVRKSHFFSLKSDGIFILIAIIFEVKGIVIIFVIITNLNVVRGAPAWEVTAMDFPTDKPSKG